MPNQYNPMMMNPQMNMYNPNMYSMYGMNGMNGMNGFGMNNGFNFNAGYGMGMGGNYGMGSMGMYGRQPSMYNMGMPSPMYNNMGMMTGPTGQYNFQFR